MRALAPRLCKALACICFKNKCKWAITSAEGLHACPPGVRPTSPDAAQLREALAAAASADAAVRAGCAAVLAEAAARERAEERAFAHGLVSQAKVGVYGQSTESL